MKSSYLKFFALNFYLIIVFSSAYFKYSFFNNQILFFGSILILSFTIILIEYKKFLRISYSVTSIIIAIYLAFLINSIVYSNFNTDIFVSIILQMGIGLALFTNRNRLVFIAFNVLLFYQTISFFFNGNDMSELLVYSRNTISVYSIAIFTMYSIALHNKSLKDSKIRSNESYLMVTLTLATCILSVGRGGIITAFILFIFVVFNYVKVKKLIMIITSLTIVIAGLFYDLIIEYSNYIFLYSKFGLEGIETGRYEMYQSYYNGLNFVSLIFGKSPNDPGLIFIEEGYHNSYILMHMHLGIGVLIIFYMIYFTAKTFLKSNHLLLLGCILSISIRAFSDEHLIRGNYLQFGIIIALYCTALSIKKQTYNNKNLKLKT